MSNLKAEPMDTSEPENNLSIKKEKQVIQEMDPTDIEKRILELCSQITSGVNDQMLQEGMIGLNITKEQRLAALNRLLSKGKIDLVKSSQHGLMYRLKDLEALNAVKDSSQDEKLIYSIIKESGNKGIWTRDISTKTNIKTKALNEVLKNLESKKIIKSVQQVNASKKKIYMLYNLEPDKSLTGGAWYSGKDFEIEFVDILNEQCHLYLTNKLASLKQTNDPLLKRNQSYVTTKEVADFIKKLGISKVELSESDIECILNTLVFDGKAEKKLSNDSKSFMYKCLQPLLGKTEGDSVSGSNLVRVPCGLCPVIDYCHDDGPISPKNCVYLKEWIDF